MLNTLKYALNEFFWALLAISFASRLLGLVHI